MTVADKVRSMTDKQLARFIMSYDANKISKKWCNKLCPESKEEDCGVCPYGEYETLLNYLKTDISKTTVAE